MQAKVLSPISSVTLRKSFNLREFMKICVHTYETDGQKRHSREAEGAEQGQA
jgi:hypothetical protein